MGVSVIPRELYRTPVRILPACIAASPPRIGGRRAPSNLGRRYLPWEGEVKAQMQPSAISPDAPVAL